MEIVRLGNVILYREKCPMCDEWDMNGDEQFYCKHCKIHFSSAGKDQVNYLSQPVNNRRHVPPGLLAALLDMQDNHCWWCHRLFGTWLLRNGKHIQLSPVLDHFLPFSYTHSCDTDELIASCQICNSFKHSKIFPSPKAVRAYLKTKWQRQLSSGLIKVL